MDYSSTYQQWEMGKAEARIQQHLEQARSRNLVAQGDKRRNVKAILVGRLMNLLRGKAEPAVSAQRVEQATR